MRRKRQKIIMIFILLLFVISIAYAVLSTNLTIDGTANVKAANWDVHFANIKVADGSITPTVAPTLTGDSTSTSFTVSLDEPGDFYEFTIDVVNAGSIDAMIDSINIGTLTTEQEKYLNYGITYDDNYMELKEKDLLIAGDTEKLVVWVEFKDDIESSDLPSSATSITFTPSITYVQNDGGVEVEHTIGYYNMYLHDINDDKTANIGESIYINPYGNFSGGSQSFYVISNDGTNVKALAEWNLLVGNTCSSIVSSSCTSLTNTTGLQDSAAKGFHYASGTTTAEYPSIGTVAFSSSTYWAEEEGATIDLKNSANIINPYLTAYKINLTNLGGKISDVSLITKAELISLGCSESSCTSAPSWVYQTSYWTRSSYNASVIWHVNSNGDLNATINNYRTQFGARPVITIKASDLDFYEPPI